MKKGIVVIVALLSSLMVGTQLNAEMKITPDSVSFPDDSFQTTASAPTWHQILPAAERFQLVMGYLVSRIMVYPAVLDKETGLVWQRNTDNTQRNWLSACAYCYGLSLGGRKGWRLPTIEELASLVDPSRNNPALPEGHPFTNVKYSSATSVYWSISTYQSLTESALGVYLFSGYVGFYGKQFENYVRCVRGGHGYDAR